MKTTKPQIILRGNRIAIPPGPLNDYVHKVAKLKRVSPAKALEFCIERGATRSEGVTVVTAKAQMKAQRILASIRSETLAAADAELQKGLQRITDYLSNKCGRELMVATRPYWEVSRSVRSFCRRPNLDARPMLAATLDRWTRPYIAQMAKGV